MKSTKEMPTKNKFRCVIHGANESHVERGSIPLVYVGDHRTTVIGTVDDLLFDDDETTGVLNFAEGYVGRMAAEMFLTNDRPPEVNVSVFGCTIIY